MELKLISFLLIAVLCVTSYKAAPSATSTFESYVRRNVPSGFTMSAFVETCESCGVLYGKDITYECLSDRSMKTFKGCFIAVNNK
ncbi:hypothetical protein DPMN_010341 [Dreissena polymorpha]|uniref:Uncharacterized protein n=1 Tax=Dreissena polymorpha TaxID=45954 RepID=A0A9D4RZ53_DREPO|nr:hypothetical protein DPMN_010341 [Dreissena polymorpha]